MLKKFATLLVITLMVIAITIVPVTATSIEPANKDKSFVAHGPMDGFTTGFAAGELSSSSLADTAFDPAYTTMIMDMNNTYAVIRTGPDGTINQGHIDSRMIVYSSDGSSPRTFPVHWDFVTGNGTDHPHPPRFVTHLALENAGDGQGMQAIAVPDWQNYGSAADGIVEVNGDLVLNQDTYTAPDAGAQDSPATTDSATTDSTTTAGTYDNTITQGEDNWHTVSVSSLTNSMNIDLKWQNASDQLRLMVYTPDGHVLGPYYDNSDGKVDGRININVSNSAGLATGNWYLKVSGSEVNGKEDYYVKTY